VPSAVAVSRGSEVREALLIYRERAVHARFGRVAHRGDARARVLKVVERAVTRLITV
jgi:hypothetical protein